MHENYVHVCVVLVIMYLLLIRNAHLYLFWHFVMQSYKLDPPLSSLSSLLPHEISAIAFGEEYVQTTREGKPTLFPGE